MPRYIEASAVKAASVFPDPNAILRAYRADQIDYTELNSLSEIYSALQENSDHETASRFFTHIIETGNFGRDALITAFRELGSPLHTIFLPHVIALKVLNIGSGLRALSEAGLNPFTYAGVVGEEIVATAAKYLPHVRPDIDVLPTPDIQQLDQIAVAPISDIGLDEPLEVKVDIEGKLVANPDANIISRHVQVIQDIDNRLSRLGQTPLSGRGTIFSASPISRQGSIFTRRRKRRRRRRGYYGLA